MTAARNRDYILFQYNLILGSQSAPLSHTDIAAGLAVGARVSALKVMQFRLKYQDIAFQTFLYTYNSIIY